ncbi:MAG: Hsp70 family protein, partial [Gemmataceae bacterium]
DITKQSAPVTVLGKGRSVVGGSIKHDLPRADVERVLLDGFFPECAVDAEPARSRSMGLQELGLPYVADAGVTKHLAQFLARQAAATERKGALLPTAVLFNGGVFKAPALRERFLNVLAGWAKSTKSEPARSLAGADLDQAVAKGAAYYGLVRRGKGIRIRGGTARAYYIGVETAAPAVPGLPPQLRAVCVAPFGMEEGTETDIPGAEFGLVVGEEAEFRFLGSSLRREDAPGAMIDDWEGQMEELSPMQVTLDGKSRQLIPVQLRTKITEVGQMEVWCQSRDGTQQWKLEFNVREVV